MKRSLKLWLGAAVALPLLGLAAAAAVLALDAAPALQASPAPLALNDPALIERGRVLALAGNCAGCHSTPGGAPYASGPALRTPFGAVYAGNLTPDASTGLGRWSTDDFWRALQHGRSADGRRLVPAFPYTETTRMPRADSDALYAWLRTLPAVAQPARPHELRWPYNTQLALAAWRVLFFRPGPWQDDAAQSAEWNRGAYLVNGPAHCVACHGGRNALGATADAGFGGGLLPTRNWYAPALNRASQASVADWPVGEIVALLRDGRAPRGQALGPMAEVVAQSTQHLPAADLRAMAVYLKSLPVVAEPAPRHVDPPAPERLAHGEKLYAEHCADCHGATGDGGVLPSGERVVPPLAGNRLVTMDPPANLVRAIALGGFGPVTAAHPRPYGMPPFAHVLSDADIADLATWLRRRENAQASTLNAFDVARWRGGD
ncbi:alcohol dehydrogenase [beta proteobacterium AAP121]|nr:alcohol dehydrogenase [beta proteobacterium AAP65]KPG00810.1 alcohol dehydrogenase [beta proteobacterium AAP121]